MTEERSAGLRIGQRSSGEWQFTAPPKFRPVPSDQRPNVASPRAIFANAHGLSLDLSFPGSDAKLGDVNAVKIRRAWDACSASSTRCSTSPALAPPSPANSPATLRHGKGAGAAQRVHRAGTHLRAASVILWRGLIVLNPGGHKGIRGRGGASAPSRNAETSSLAQVRPRGRFAQSGFARGCCSREECLYRQLSKGTYDDIRFAQGAETR